jgi:SAM-dependent methyltransferase
MIGSIVGIIGLEQQMLKDHQDAFGHEMYDHHAGKGGFEIVERDDGFFSISAGPRLYFLEYTDWPPSEREAMQHVQGRVLDIGCGAGRHSLYLQAQGFDVVGTDASPLAVEVCRLRGLRQVQVAPITQLSRRLGVFDTIVMMGNNFALTGTPQRARWLLRRFHGMTSETGRILAQTRDPYGTDVPEHLAYHAHNREQGRMSGQARLRVRYKRYVTPCIDFLMLSAAEMRGIVGGTGWEVRQVIEDQAGVYVAVLEKAKT